jgi:hypothetical protein
MDRLAHLSVSQARRSSMTIILGRGSAGGGRRRARACWLLAAAGAGAAGLLLAAAAAAAEMADASLRRCSRVRQRPAPPHANKLGAPFFFSELRRRQVVKDQQVSQEGRRAPPRAERPASAPHATRHSAAQQPTCAHVCLVPGNREGAEYRSVTGSPGRLGRLLYQRALLTSVLALARKLPADDLPFAISGTVWRTGAPTLQPKQTIDLDPPTHQTSPVLLPQSRCTRGSGGGSSKW